MKRGEVSIGVLISILAVLISFFVLMVFLLGIAGLATVEVVDKACEASVALRSENAVAINTNDDTIAARVSISPFLCKTIIKDIPEKDKKTGFLFFKKKETPQEQIQYELAEHLKSCWQQMGQGRFNPIFSSVQWSGEPEARCFTCFDISLKEPIDVKEFYNEYLVTTPVKVNDPESPTYLEYLTTDGGCGYLFLPSEIKPFERYGITYMGPGNLKFTGDHWEWTVGGGVAAGTAGGYLTFIGITAAAGAVGIPLTTGVVLGGTVIGAAVSSYTGVRFVDYVYSGATSLYEWGRNLFVGVDGDRELQKNCAGILMQPISKTPDSCFYYDIKII